VRCVTERSHSNRLREPHIDEDANWVRRWVKPAGNTVPRAVISTPQMATKTQIRAEDYLRMTFEHEAEFVHGEIVERGAPV